MRRRELLQIGSIAAIGAALPFSIAAVRPVALVYDRRYAPARMLAAASGARAHALPHDPVALWRGFDATARIAGLTTYADMMMFADLARASGRRTTIRIAHHLGDAGATHVAHEGALRIASLSAAGSSWPIALWSLFGGSPNGIAIASDDRRGTLWSWILDR